MIDSNSSLVLGSRRGCNLPDLKVKEVFSSNASAIKANIYKKNILMFHLRAVLLLKNSLETI